MQTAKKGGLTILAFERLSTPHFVTTRQGGFSRQPFGSLNLAYHVGDDPAIVAQNRILIDERLNPERRSFVFADQVHGAHVHRVRRKDAGCGWLGAEDAIKKTDALITDAKGIYLAIMTADCVPVLLYDPIKRAIGAAHAGWKGADQKILSKTIGAMKECFGSDPADLVAALGPAIGPCCYEVGEEVACRFLGSRGVVSRQGKTYLNLWEILREELRQAGLLEAAIEISGFCTACHSDLLFSYRKEGGKTGRFISAIALP